MIAGPVATESSSLKMVLGASSGLAAGPTTILASLKPSTSDSFLNGY